MIDDIVTLEANEKYDFVAELRSLLKQEIFYRKEGLTSGERCAQSYQCLLEVGEISNITEKDILSCSDNLLQLHEWTGFVNGTLLTLLSIHYNLCLGTILSTKSKHQQISSEIEALLQMKYVGVFLATELGYGNNVINLKTTAVFNKDRRTFTINTPCAEAKKFMPNTAYQAIPKLACVLARLYVDDQDQGVFPFIVPLQADDGSTQNGVHITALGEKPGYDLDNAITWFENVEIPERYALLGDNVCFDSDGEFVASEKGVNRRFYRAISRVQSGKLCLSGGIANGLKAIMTLVCRFSGQRLTFGPTKTDVPVNTYLTHRNSIMKYLAQVVAIDSLYEFVKDARRPIFEAPLYELYVAILKSYVSDRALSVLNGVRQRVGAQGLFSETGIIEHIITVHGVITAEGDNLVIRQKSATELVQKKLFRELIPEDTLSAPIEVEALSDCKKQEQYILALLAYCYSCARRELRNSSESETRFTSWNNSIDKSLKCLDAFSLLTVHGSLVRKQSKAKTSAEKNYMSALTTLYFLDELPEFYPEYMALGMLSKGAVDGIDFLRNKMLDIVYESTDDILDAFNIPDEILRSPLRDDHIETYNQRSGALPRDTVGGRV